ncbi:MAG: hypothetical protein JNM22_21625 [Saprospiraceae bacterium]|nr:hypothetical protein [Saprospiraceae bacterium]
MTTKLTPEEVAFLRQELGKKYEEVYRTAPEYSTSEIHATYSRLELAINSVAVEKVLHKKDTCYFHDCKNKELCKDAREKGKLNYCWDQDQNTKKSESPSASKRQLCDLLKQNGRDSFRSGFIDSLYMYINREREEVLAELAVVQPANPELHPLEHEPELASPIRLNEDILEQHPQPGNEEASITAPFKNDNRLSIENKRFTPSKQSGFIENIPKWVFLFISVLCLAGALAYNKFYQCPPCSDVAKSGIVSVLNIDSILNRERDSLYIISQSVSINLSSWKDVDLSHKSEKRSVEVLDLDIEFQKIGKANYILRKAFTDGDIRPEFAVTDLPSEVIKDTSGVYWLLISIDTIPVNSQRKIHVTGTYWNSCIRFDQEDDFEYIGSTVLYRTRQLNLTARNLPLNFINRSTDAELKISSPYDRNTIFKHKGSLGPIVSDSIHTTIDTVLVGHRYRLLWYWRL